MTSDSISLLMTDLALVSDTNQPPKINSNLESSGSTSSMLPQLETLMELKLLLTGNQGIPPSDSAYITHSMKILQQRLKLITEDRSMEC